VKGKKDKSGGDSEESLPNSKSQKIQHVSTMTLRVKAMKEEKRRVRSGRQESLHATSSSDAVATDHRDERPQNSATECHPATPATVTSGPRTTCDSPPRDDITEHGPRIRHDVLVHGDGCKIIGEGGLVTVTPPQAQGSAAELDIAPRCAGGGDMNDPIRHRRRPKADDGDKDPPRLDDLVAAARVVNVRDHSPGGHHAIVRGTCRMIAPGAIVLADRVCIDLVRSLFPTEGCWIGSSSHITALVLSEEARPFRVNAGPVHSHVVMGDGVSTKYLSELVPGDEVLVFDVVSGKERPVTVGRSDVDVRPCVQCGLLAVDAAVVAGAVVGDHGRDYHAGQVFLERAEYVRLARAIGDGSFLRITDLECGGEENVSSRASSDVLLRVVGSG